MDNLLTNQSDNSPPESSINSYVPENFKSAIKDIAERTFAKKLIVDQQKGPFKTISAAIEAAVGKTIIRVNRGLYMERLVITKPDIKIEPFSKESSNELILLSEEASTIEIDIPSGGRFEISNFKVGHNAKKEEKGVLDDEDKSNVISALIDTNAEEMFTYDDNDSKGWVSNNLNVIRPSMVCLVKVLNGSLMMKACGLSLNFLKRSTDYVIPAVVVLGTSSSAVFKQTTIRGNHMHKTLGVYVQDASCVLEECIITNQLVGGVFLNCTNSRKRNLITKISHCIFEENSGPYVEMVGLGNKSIIENNMMKGDLKVIGIKAGVGTCPRIFNNEIREMSTAIHVVSADAMINRNRVLRCIQGIVACTFDTMINKSKIKLNDISRCTKVGVHISGKNNFTVVT